MKRSTLLLAAMVTALASPMGLAATELETLRALCAEQERQIRQLEDENSKLRSLAEGSRSVLTPTAAPTSVATPAIYTIKAGDSLVKIARQTGTTPETLAKLNGIKKPELIRPGQKLKLPVADQTAPSPAPSPAPAASGRTHTVRQGDTFFSIARAHQLSADEVIAANPEVKPSALRPGQVIRLAASTSTAASEPAPAPSPRSTPPAPKPGIRSITIDGEMTYGEFAARHGSDVNRLNDLNGLDLDTSTVLAKGSELYIPAQP